MLNLLEIKKYSIIYIACPAALATGGPELLHQLCHTLRHVGIDARMYYFPTDVSNPKPEVYSGYDTVISNTILDRSENIFIVPEVFTNLIREFKHIRKTIWWLSVDNYYAVQFTKTRKNYCIRIINKVFNIFGFRMKFDLIKLTPQFIYTHQLERYILDKELDHFVQSEYAKQHLLTKNININHIHYLSDFLNKDYISAQNAIQERKRNNIVLYNPKKGLLYTQKLMNLANDIQWIPLINLKRSEVIDLLQKSKVYVDFGNHPGKDRFPREAAICGCCVITGLTGSAKYYEDVPIPDSYKFKETEEDLIKIIDCIRDCLKNYDQRQKDFDHYRQLIKSEEDKFTVNVQQIFSPSDNIQVKSIVKE